MASGKTTFTALFKFVPSLRIFMEGDHSVSSGMFRSDTAGAGCHGYPEAWPGAFLQTVEQTGNNFQPGVCIQRPHH